MTGEQCRAARERLNWTRLELAAATNVSSSAWRSRPRRDRSHPWLGHDVG